MSNTTHPLGAGHPEGAGVVEGVKPKLRKYVYVSLQDPEGHSAPPAPIMTPIFSHNIGLRFRYRSPPHSACLPPLRPCAQARACVGAWKGACGRGRGVFSLHVPVCSLSFPLSLVWCQVNKQYGAKTVDMYD